MSEENFKDPYSLRHFLGLLVVFLIPTLPATLTLIKVFLKNQMVTDFKFVNSNHYYLQDYLIHLFTIIKSS